MPGVWRDSGNGRALSAAPQARPGEGRWRYRRVAPASAAVKLFEEALEQFRADITHLARHREYLQGERFAVREEWVTGFEVPREKTPVMRRYLREGTDADSWRI